MMTTVLGVQNMRKWSWSLFLLGIAQRLPECHFAMMVGKPSERIDAGLVDFFDIVLVQNAGTIKLSGDRRKIILRIGGLYVDDKNPSTRFDKDLAKVGAVIATNAGLFEIGKRVNSSTFLIPNGVDLQLFKPRPQRQQPFNNNDNKPFVVGFSGNIHGHGAVYKGWEYYVQATMRLRPRIETKHAMFGHEQIPHDEMPEKFYRQVDCLVLPSLNEGCSNSIAEALACGVPVLTTKVGFHGERLEDGVNCLFIERNIDSIMEKIKLLMDSPELRVKLAFEGRVFAENNHDINKLAHEYDKVFRLVLERNNNI